LTLFKKLLQKKMAEQEYLMRCFYAVVYQVSMEIAREDLIMPSLAIRRFLQNYSWFHSLVNRLHAQAFHKRHKREYEVDDLFPVINPHDTVAEEDADPKWFCVRKLKKLFNEVAAELAELGPMDPRQILLDYVSRFLDNCVENPINYTVRVIYTDYHLELDNMDIKGLTQIVAMCSYRERCREAREQGLPTQGLIPPRSSVAQSLSQHGLSLRDIERNQRAVIMQQDQQELF
jgi:hypothetical protein